MENRAFISQTRATVGHARSRLNALQVAMDSKVKTLERRVAEQMTLLETEAARRGQLEVELADAMERAQRQQRRADFAEDNIRPPVSSPLPVHQTPAGALREEVRPSPKPTKKTPR